MNRVLQEMRAFLGPALAFWGALVLGIGMFSAAVLFTEGFSGENMVILSGFWVGSLLGLLVGQLVAIFRLRDWVGCVGAAMVATCALLLILALVYSGLTELALMPAVVMFWSPFFVLFGMWSLRVHKGLLAALAPMLFVTGTVLVLADASGSDNRWHAGDKWAVWDVFTAPVLVTGVTLVLVYLVARELYRVHRWQTSRFATQRVIEQDAGDRRKRSPVRATLGSLLVLGTLVAVLSVSSALVAPYLWRTGPGDRERPDSTERPIEAPSPQEQQGRREEQSGCSQGAGEQEWQEDDEGEQREQQSPEELAESMKEAAKQTLSALSWLVMLLILTLLAIAVFGPPFRRTALFRHLRRPLWPVPPTRAIQLQWRRVEIALADHGVLRRPGDSACYLAARASTHVPEVDPVALMECAKLVDRVVYGLGVQPSDVERARRSAEMTCSSLWDLLTEKEKFKAIYRWV